MTHNQVVPGSSPGWTTELKIKHLQLCRCFFYDFIIYQSTTLVQQTN